MTTAAPSALSPKGSALLAALRTWTVNLDPTSVMVQEEDSPGYGGLLFKVKPAQPGAMALTVGLGTTDDVDFFWGEGYRWERATLTPQEVLTVCDAIRGGEVVEETWRLGPVVIERRCSLGPDGKLGSDGSASMPKWLKRWARLSTRTFAPWVPGVAY